MKVLSCTFIFVVTLAISTGNTTQVLKFGTSVRDYIMFSPNMEAFTSQFSVCSWVKKLKTDGYPFWFHYKSTSISNEIIIADNGYSGMFSSYYLYKVDQLGITPGTWYHYCMCWSVSSNTADVYHNGIKVGSITT